jgi:short-subunit dehydrogenase
MTRPIALVTGASAGIGAVFAQRLANDDYDLVLVARDRERLEKLAAELPTDTEVLAADLTNADELSRVEERCRGEARPLDLLVNNAGFATAGPFVELDLDGEDREIRLNVVSLARLTHAALRGMVERGRGGVINVSSVASYQPGPYNATYAATKAFVTSFSQAIHEEVRSKGVTVTVLCPGPTHTEFADRAGLHGWTGPGFMWQQPEDVVEAALRDHRRRAAVSIPGIQNRAAAAFSSIMPTAITRKIAAAVMSRAK